MKHSGALHQSLLIGSGNIADYRRPSCQVVRRHLDGVSWAIAAYAPWFDVERRSDC
mgnify:CR=1 FL=1